MKLPVISGKQLVKFLNKEGFEVVRRKGSQVRLKKKSLGKIIVTIVPMHKRLDQGTLLGILRQCKISKEKMQENVK